MVDILDDHTGPARKPHVCDQCGRRIEIGERYRRQVYKDGELVTYKAHEDCDNAATAYADISGFDARYDEPHPLYNALDPEDYGWLLNEWPTVAGRFNIQGPVRPKCNELPSEDR